MSETDTLGLQGRLRLANNGSLSLEDLKQLRRDAEIAGNYKIANETGYLVEAMLGSMLGLNSDLLERSIEQVYFDSRNRTRRHPYLQLNSSVQPSAHGHHRQTQPIEKATINYDPNSSSLWNDPSTIPVPILYKTNADSHAKKIKSHFKPHTRTDPLKYQNEIEVQVHTKFLVEDATKCLGLSELLTNSLEISRYGCTPDIIVVTMKNTVVFTIKVKSPDRLDTDDDVLSNPLVVCQLWLYLMGQKQSGMENPIGAVCTFNKIRLFSLSDFSSIQVQIKSAYEKLKEVENNGGFVFQEKPPAPISKSLSSPLPKEKSVSETNKRFKKGDKFLQEPEGDNIVQQSEDEEIKGFGVRLKPRMYAGPIMEGKDVLPTLMHAIQVAYDGSSDAKEECHFVEDNGDLGGRLFPLFSPDSIGFIRTRSDLTATDNGKLPQASTENLASLGSLGRGNTAETYFVSTADGTLATAKLYTMTRSFLATEDERTVEEEDKIKALNEAACGELDRWHKIYGDQSARITKVNGRNALLMRYGRQLRTVNDRILNLPAIEKELTRFAKLGFVYEHSDLRWRHVLKLRDDSFMLVDLGSLTYKEEGIEDVEKEVNSQMVLLKKRIGEDVQES